jgi:hypothetical protein
MVELHLPKLTATAGWQSFWRRVAASQARKSDCLAMEPLSAASHLTTARVADGTLSFETDVMQIV